MANACSVHSVQPGGRVPVKLLQEILGQEGEEGVLGCADSVAGVSPGELLPVLVERVVVGEHDPPLCKVAARRLLLWEQQRCGFGRRLGEALSDLPLPPVPRGVH